MKLTMRAAVAADWDLAWPIQREAGRELVTRTWGGWDEVQVRKCAEAWDPSQTRIVEEYGEMVGWVRLEHHPGYDWLDLIVVAPQHQGRGLGTLVMRTLLREAQDRGVPLWLSVYQSNRARHLYARLGFSELPRDEIRVFMVFPPTTDPDPPR